MFWTNTRAIPSLLCYFPYPIVIAYGIYSVYEQCHFCFCRLISTNALSDCWQWCSLCYAEIKFINWFHCLFHLCEIAFLWINHIWQTWTKKPGVDLFLTIFCILVSFWRHVLPTNKYWKFHQYCPENKNATSPPVKTKLAWMETDRAKVTSGKK